MTSKEEQEATDKIIKQPSHLAACKFLKQVNCVYREEDDGLAYTTRYFDFIHGFNKGYDFHASQSGWVDKQIICDSIRELYIQFPKTFDANNWNGCIDRVLTTIIDLPLPDKP